MLRGNKLTVEWTTWNDSEETAVTTWHEAEMLLERIRLHSDPPRIIEFYDAMSGQSFGMGVGRDETVVTYQDSLDPPYFISLGNKDRSDVEWFCYANEETEYFAKNLVPVEQGLAALKEFVDNRTRPMILTWEQL